MYLRLSSAQLALRRIAARVRQGGHAVPRADALRRIARRWENFVRVYRLLADVWTGYDNSGTSPQLVERSMKRTKSRKESEIFSAGVGRGLRMAARSARRTARMYGTPIYVWENGKVVAKKP